MEILKTMIPSDEGLFLCDTIEYEGHLWLVPQWIDGNPTKGYSKPVRIIRLTSLSYSQGIAGISDYVLNDPIPKSVWQQGVVPQELKILYIVIENPDIVVLTPSGEPPTYH